MTTVLQGQGQKFKLDKEEKWLAVTGEDFKKQIGGMIELISKQKFGKSKGKYKGTEFKKWERKQSEVHGNIRNYSSNEK